MDVCLENLSGRKPLSLNARPLHKALLFCTTTTPQVVLFRLFITKGKAEQSPAPRGRCLGRMAVRLFRLLDCLAVGCRLFCLLSFP